MLFLCLKIFTVLFYLFIYACKIISKVLNKSLEDLALSYFARIISQNALLFILYLSDMVQVL